MKKLFSIILGAALLFALAGCSNTPSSEVINGEVGTTYEALFFDFTVKSGTSTSSYAGIEAAEGMQLIDVVINVKNTFGEEQEMYYSEFQLQWGEDEDEDAYAIVLDQADETMAPDITVLADGETMEYHYVFEAPADENDFLLVYLEMYVTSEGDEGYGNLYRIPFTV